MILSRLKVTAKGEFSPINNLTAASSIMAVVVLMGTLGYRYLQGWSLLDSFYMTIITLTTVGFGEVGKLTSGGKVFTVFLIIMGVGAVGFAIGSLAEILLKGHLMELFDRRRMHKEINMLKNHSVVVGYGKMGETICDEFLRRKQKFVVIEKDEELAERVISKGMLAVHGNGGEEETLASAGIASASSLVSVATSDADNLMITLTARGMNADLHIVSRAQDSNAEKKIYQVGANKVVSPYVIGGLRMAQAVMRPAVVDFLEVCGMHRHHLYKEQELLMEQIPVSSNSHFSGKKLSESSIRQDFGVVVIAIKRKNGEMNFNPSPEENIEEGDNLIVVGHDNQLQGLMKMAAG
ncbi:MAG: potassium channel protein [bacterium]